LALLLLFPVFALLVRLDSKGPVLFRQMRVGRDGELISVLKVRTMRIDAESVLRSDPQLWASYVQNGYKLPERQDPRVTRFGAWLRRTSLDEMPQFFCVLRGSMSLVGPRPVLPDELPALYGELAGEYEAVKPGLTGLWQVSGRSRVIDGDRARLDAEYVRSWSPIVELGILVRTIPAVLLARGAH
jgi:lipopolysaccharide/colanic/teichoic acid biosynthesis glycosyltransferase